MAMSHKKGYKPQEKLRRSHTKGYESQDSPRGIRKATKSKEGYEPNESLRASRKAVSHNSNPHIPTLSIN